MRRTYEHSACFGGAVGVWKMKDALGFFGLITYCFGVFCGGLVIVLLILKAVSLLFGWG